MRELYNYNGASIGLADYVTPEMYGAKGNGTTDDRAAIQSALDVGGLVRFMTGKTYRITSTLWVKADTVIDLNGSTIQCTVEHAFYNFQDGDSYGGYNGKGNITICNGTIVGGCISFIHGNGITLRNVSMLNTLNDHFVEICACRNYTIEGCSFVGMKNIANRALEYINIDTNASYLAFPHNQSGQNDPVFYDMTTNREVTVRDSYFSPGEGEYAYGFDAVGVHSRNVSNTYAENVVIENNQIKGFTGCGIRVNAMDGACVSNNYIDTVGDGIRIGDVADAKNIVIKDNYVTSSNGQKLVRTSGQYVSLTVANNVTEGDTQDF